MPIESTKEATTIAQSIAVSAINAGLRWLGKTLAFALLARVGQHKGRKRVSFVTTKHDQLTGLPSMMRTYRLLAVLLPLCGGCVVVSKQIDPTSELAEAKVRPGITVLLRGSIQLIRGKRNGLLTNQTGVNEKGVSDIDLLRDKK